MAQQGEKIWQVMPHPGRKPKYATSDDLWAKFIDYCQWVDANPWLKRAAGRRQVRSNAQQGESTVQDMKEFQRPYTLAGFCAYAGLSNWTMYKKRHEDDEGYLQVIAAIENVVLSQQLEGAFLHQFDSNLVARINGISDKMVQQITSSDGEPLKLPKLTDDDFETLRQLNDKL